MNKWDYIEKIRKASTNYKDTLLDLLDLYNKSNLQEITLEEARTYYETYILNNRGRL